jgi:surface antigen
MQEREHALWVEQQSKKLDLRLTASGQNREWSNTDATYGPVVITARVKNGSDKTGGRVLLGNPRSSGSSAQGEVSGPGWRRGAWALSPPRSGRHLRQYSRPLPA